MNREQWIKVINDRQNMYVSQLADIIVSDNLKKEIFFNSPTGTGKTVMVSRLIKKMYPLGFFFLITTLSKGGLNLQVDSSIKKSIKERNFLVFGVSGYTSKTLLQGKDILKQIPSGIKLVWIRDEGHIKSNKWTELLFERAFKIVNVSATNKQVDIQCNFSDTPLLRTPYQMYGTPRDAVEKLLEVKKAHKFVKHYNPCLIVRDVNGAVTKEFLSLCEENSLRVINITGYDVDVQKLCEDDNEYDVIINKLKITEGIDIPRASVIYIGNRPSNEATVIQLIGRVRRNALLWNKDIDIFRTHNEKLLQETSKTYIYYKVDGSNVPFEDNGELSMELSDTICVDSLIPKSVYVRKNELVNGYKIAELGILGNKYTGILYLNKDDNDVVEISNIPEIYKKQTETIEEFGTRFKKIVKDSEQIKVALDKSKFYRFGEKGEWKTTTSVSDNVQYGRLSRFLSNRYVNELQSIEKYKLERDVVYKQEESISKKEKVCVGIVTKLYFKYLLYGENFLKPFIEIALHRFKHEIKEKFDYNDIVFYACLQYNKKLMKLFYGPVIENIVPVLSEIEVLNLSRKTKRQIITMAEKAIRKLKPILLGKFDKELDFMLSPHLGTRNILHGIVDCLNPYNIIMFSCRGLIDREMIYKALAFHFLSTKRFDLHIETVTVYDFRLADYVTINIDESNLTTLKYFPAQKISNNFFEQMMFEDFDIANIKQYYSMYGKEMTIEAIKNDKEKLAFKSRYNYVDRKTGKHFSISQKEILRIVSKVGDADIVKPLLKVVEPSVFSLQIALEVNDTDSINEISLHVKPNKILLLKAIQVNNVEYLKKYIPKVKVSIEHLEAAVIRGNTEIIKSVVENINITKRIVNDIIRLQEPMSLVKMLKKIKPTTYNMIIAIKTKNVPVISEVGEKCCCITRRCLIAAQDTKDKSVMDVVKKMYNEKLLKKRNR